MFSFDLLFDFIYHQFNLPVRERLDLVLLFILHLLDRPYEPSSYRTLAAGVFIANMFWLLRILGASRAVALCGAIGGAVIGGFVAGWDPVALKIHWFPGMFAADLRSQTAPSWRVLIVLMLLGTLFVASAGSLAPFGVVLAAVTVRLIAPCKSPGYQLKSMAAWIEGSLLIAAILVIPVYVMPDYPGDAVLAPISPLTFQPPPLVGPSLGLNTLVYPEVVTAHYAYTNRFLLVSALLLVLAVATTGRRSRQAFALACLLGGTSAALLVEGFTAAKSLATPFEVVRRVIPGIALTPLPWLLLPLVMVVALQLFVPRIRGKHAMALLVLTLLLPIVEKIFPAAFSVRKLNIAWRPLHGGTTSTWSNVIFSPSQFAVNSFGAWVLEPDAQKKITNLTLLVAGKDYNFTATASVNPDDAGKAFDGDFKTRWATARAQQQGDTFEFALDRPRAVRRIVLSIRETPTDFPRGVQLLIGEGDQQLKTVLRFPTWSGPVHWTERGYPYFGPQSEVIFDLPQNPMVSRIKIVQTSNHHRFDWSINEVRLFSQPAES